MRLEAKKDKHEILVVANFCATDGLLFRGVCC